MAQNWRDVCDDDHTTAIVVRLSEQACFNSPLGWYLTALLCAAVKHVSRSPLSDATNACRRPGSMAESENSYDSRARTSTPCPRAVRAEVPGRMAEVMTAADARHSCRKCYRAGLHEAGAAAAAGKRSLFTAPGWCRVRPGSEYRRIPCAVRPASIALRRRSFAPMSGPSDPI